MPGGSIHPSPLTIHQPVPVCGQASELSADDVLQHLPIQSQVRHDLLQPAILVLQRLQPTHLVGQQPAIALLPVEVGRLTDPCLAADLRNRRSFLALLQGERLSRASVNFDAFIVLSSSPSREMLAENSSFKRSSSQGAEQVWSFADRLRNSRGLRPSRLVCGRWWL